MSQEKDLPEKCCARCVFYNANQGAVIEKTEDKQCLWHGRFTDDTDVCDDFTSPNSTENNVPNFVRNGTMKDPNPNPLDGPTEILIISHEKDFDWLVCALKCISKYFTGQQGITVAHPNKDSERFATLRHQFDIRLYGYDEVPGKGHIQHMAVMASADTFLPVGTKYLLTTDSDGMMRMATTPEHYAWNDKPYWITRKWESIDPSMPGGDNRQWQPVTDAQLGFQSELFTMCMNIQLIPMDLLSPYRRHIESVHRKPFLQYMLEGKNDFPPSRVDFNALGAYFHKFHRDWFHWFDAGAPPYPVDRKKSYWSHGGITPEIRAEIEGFLK